MPPASFSRPTASPKGVKLQQIGWNSSMMVARRSPSGKCRINSSIRGGLHMLGKAASRSSLLLLLSAFTAPGLHAQTCGGTERWQVKVGTDSGAASVQLQTVVPKTLQELINLQSLALPDDNVTRL